MRKGNQQFTAAVEEELDLDMEEMEIEEGLDLDEQESEMEDDDESDMEDDDESDMEDDDESEMEDDNESDMEDDDESEMEDEGDLATKEPEQDPEELDEFEFDMEDLVPSVSNQVRRNPEAGVLSIVNSDNGKRVVISSEVAKNLQLSETVQIGYIKGYIVISQQLGAKFTSYDLKKYGAKHAVYSTELVNQVTNYHQLDFSKRTSITFSKATYQTKNGNKVALIHVK